LISVPSCLTSVATDVEETRLATNFTLKDVFRVDTLLKAIALIRISAKAAAEKYLYVFMVYGFYGFLSQFIFQYKITSSGMFLQE
jgi:hypothetical protein